MENAKISLQNREEVLQKISTQETDLLIIGGGITGAGIALDAVSRGMKVTLVEMQDFAKGTSSRSTKLVHGGLRYLKQFAFGIVREVGKERKIVHQNARHIVLPEEMILPIRKNGSFGKLATSVALWTYDFLANVNKDERRKMLSVSQTLNILPTLNPEGLLGGAHYYEYKTDDARLTIEVLKKAIELGALVINYVKAETFLYNTNKKIVGINAIDCISGEKMEIRALQTINATGPWTDKVRKSDYQPARKRLKHTKGVHITVSKEDFPLSKAVYFDTDDKRMIFAIPRGKIVYIGTTDTSYEENLEKPVAENADVEYLLKHTNSNFSGIQLNNANVLSSWAGLRPLIFKKGKSPSELSRRDEVFIARSGLISIAGGKLTGYRLMAKKIVNIAQKRLKKFYGKQFLSCHTEQIKLAGGEFNFLPHTYKLIEFADIKYDEAKQTGISAQDFKKLFYRYGTNIELITNKAFEFFNVLKNSEKAWLKAEIWYSVNYEMCLFVSDFLVRRTGMVLFDNKKILEILPLATSYFAEFLNLNKDEVALQEKIFIEEMKEYAGFSKHF